MWRMAITHDQRARGCFIYDGIYIILSKFQILFCNLARDCFGLPQEECYLSASSIQLLDCAKSIHIRPNLKHNLREP